MDFKEYQKKAVTTALYIKSWEENYPYLPNEVKKVIALSYVTLGLGEVGEIQNKMKKIIRDTTGQISEDFKKDISKEIGDVLWYCANICEELNLNLQKVAEENLEKLFSRKKRGVIQGSGDNR